MVNWIWLAPSWVKEVLDVYQTWEGKNTMPLKLKELMMVLEIEISRRYKPETQNPVPRTGR